MLFCLKLQHSQSNLYNTGQILRKVSENNLEPGSQSKKDGCHSYSTLANTKMPHLVNLTYI